ncbi:MAG: hypothetical protein AB8F95_09210, partial [Bacteroidia bacterium]
IRHSKDGLFSHQKVLFKKHEVTGVFDLLFTPGNDVSDTIKLPKVNLLEWMPTAPDHVKGDDYLEYLAIINQEWNRQQVRFYKEGFKSSGKSNHNITINRVDLARNCLNALLWEIIYYAEEDGKTSPIYHGWFSVPQALYADLFYAKNNIPYEKYKEPLENWVDPELKSVNLRMLREVSSEESLHFYSSNDEFYPLQGERKKKYKNILAPAKPQSIGSFLNDSTKFATFSPPGLYTKRDPRSTQLGRFFSLDSAYMRKTVSKREAGGTFAELELVFSDQEENRITRIIVGGLTLKDLPELSTENVNQGFQMPMGIGNHTFYESYADCLANPTATSPYFGLTLDSQRNFLDSHALGIDGPLIYKDILNPNKIHFWLLSFERHALVGHYILDTAVP